MCQAPKHSRRDKKSANTSFYIACTVSGYKAAIQTAEALRPWRELETDCEEISRLLRTDLDIVLSSNPSPLSLQPRVPVLPVKVSTPVPPVRQYLPLPCHRTGPSLCPLVMLSAASWMEGWDSMTWELRSGTS